jgi:adenylate kinase family enzyme
MKIMIFGRPGSGKSTFALNLSQKLNIPVYHLDKIFYVNNWVERNYQEFLNMQQNLATQNNWIIDGNATKSLELRYAQADIVIYFLMPRLTCLWRILKRKLFKDPQIDDRAPNCPERIMNLKFLIYTWTFNKRVKKQIMELQSKYPNTKFYKICSNKQLIEIKNAFGP